MLMKVENIKKSVFLYSRALITFGDLYVKGVCLKLKQIWCCIVGHLLHTIDCLLSNTKEGCHKFQLVSLIWPKITDDIE